MNLKEEILQKTNRGLEVFYFYMPIEMTSVHLAISTLTPNHSAIA